MKAQAEAQELDEDFDRIITEQRESNLNVSNWIKAVERTVVH